MVVYIDRDCIALVHKLPQGDEHHFDIILHLDIGCVNTSFCLQIGQTEPDTPTALACEQNVYSRVLRLTRHFYIALHPVFVGHFTFSVA